jgi:ssDNA-binding Zn-finger/Zn-ribbon topoisomerase 1
MKTKWIPLTFYEHESTVYCVLGKKNPKTGMIYFRIKKVSGWFHVCNNYPTLDINKQFQLINV